MALNPNVSGSFTDHIRQFISDEFLTKLRKQLVLAPLGKSKVLPQHQGQTVKWNRYADFAANTTPLTEGVTPNGQALSSSAVTATLAQYGDFVTIADFFQKTAVGDTIREANDQMAYQAALTVDSLVRNELDQNGTQNYTGANASQNDVEVNLTEISSADLKKITKNMRENNVPAYEDRHYRGVLHPLMEHSLLNETGTSDYIILASNNTSATSAIEDAEIGKAFGLKLMRSTNIRTDSEANTYGNIFVGRDAFGTVDLQSENVRIIMKGFAEGGTEDPLEQRATIAWKFAYATKVLQAVRAQILWAYGT